MGKFLPSTPFVLRRVRDVIVLDHKNALSGLLKKVKKLFTRGHEIGHNSHHIASSRGHSLHQRPSRKAMTCLACILFRFCFR